MPDAPVWPRRDLRAGLQGVDLRAAAPVSQPPRFGLPGRTGRHPVLRGVPESRDVRGAPVQVLLRDQEGRNHHFCVCARRDVQGDGRSAEQGFWGHWQGPRRCDGLIEVEYSVYLEQHVS